MSPEQLLAHFDRISEAPNAVPRLRAFILDLAVRGKLVRQDPNEARAYDNASVDDRTGSELAANWRRVRFGELLDLRYGEGLPKGDRAAGGTVPVYGSNGIVGHHTEALAASPAIIVGRKGAAGALNVAHGPSWTTDVAYFLIPPSCFHLDFLFVLLKTLRLERLSRGVKPGLSRAQANEQFLVIPPLGEQQRIVLKVNDLMALCNRLEAAQSERERRRDRLVVASLHRLNEPPEDSSLFREHVGSCLGQLRAMTLRSEHVEQLRETIRNLAVTGRLVAEDPREQPAIELLKQIRAAKAKLVKEGRLRPMRSGPNGESPPETERISSWEAVRFADVCNVVTSGSRGWAEFYSATGPKFIRAQNIRFGKLLLNPLACVQPPKSSEGSRTQVAEGDVLIVITGAGVTNPAVLDRDLGEAYVSQHVALIRPGTTDLSQWLLLWLMAPAGGRANMVDRAYGAGKPGLNLDNIRSLPVSLPPLAEQRRIVAKVAELMVLCDHLEAQIAIAQTEASRFLEAVLHEALGIPATTAVGV